MSDYETLAQQLIRDEGIVLHAYQDSMGFWTIGVGRLIDARRGGGLTREEALELLHNDILKHTKAVVQRLPWADATIGPARFGALINMHFQLGDGLFAFIKTLAFMQNGKWAEAADEMLNSAWAHQTPERAKRISEQIRSNIWT